MFRKIKKRIKKIQKKEKGFLVLIAVLVSMILLSIGTFIASVAVREIRLSSSVKDSQKAFFAADAVLECALFKEFKAGGFASAGPYTTHNTQSALKCNGFKYDWAKSINTYIDRNTGNEDITGGGNAYEVTKTVYYISLKSSLVDNDSNGLIDLNEIKNTPGTVDAPYVKLIVYKAHDINDNSRIRVFGHNVRVGKGVTERAIETVY